jgi:hypothetical protein
MVNDNSTLRGKVAGAATLPSQLSRLSTPNATQNATQTQKGLTAEAISP